MSMKKSKREIQRLQRELLQAVVTAGVICLQLVGACAGAHIESGEITRKIVRGVFKITIAILAGIATQYLMVK
ncbi:hypothetical protein [Arthrobacter sp. SLBN-112]|uniref:hypothetical protein n=1 Tax=Arthrobacter sp. SLBN-112 TaxID=2768452 RepID=UPI0027B6CFDC|nr:hypothetical protein [Arthrobacter sp. SLBN-112]MDQ0801505.1 hypothetical protein [Arthrobacter sp. SLBN-112]